MEQYDVILLLGSRLHDDGTPDLNVLARVRMAAELWEKGVAPVIVASGYKGFNSEFHNTTQADVMAEFLIQFGIPNECIIREDKSETTWENIQNTKKLLGKEHFTAAVATSDTHMRRSLYMCIKQKAFRQNSPATGNGVLEEGWNVCCGWKPMSDGVTANTRNGIVLYASF